VRYQHGQQCGRIEQHSCDYGPGSRVRQRHLESCSLRTIGRPTFKALYLSNAYAHYLLTHASASLPLVDLVALPLSVTRKWSQTNNSGLRTNKPPYLRKSFANRKIHQSVLPLPTPNRRATMVLTTTSLTSLPPELILEFSDLLAPDAILALKLTHRKFNETLPFLPHLKHESFSKCAHLAIRTYLTRPSPNPSHHRCILCKKVYPASLFRSASSPACVPVSWEENVHQTDVVELPQRLCSWHVGRLARIIHTGPGGRNEWTSHMGEMCMHCGAIQGWGRCDCNCDSCAIRLVRTYTRYLNNENECRRFLFWKDRTRSEGIDLPNDVYGRLMVRETGWDPGKSDCRTIAR
jgi:hypothetical protein